MLWSSLRQIRSDDSRKRLHAARKLGDSRDPRAIAALIDSLADSDIEVRRAAATALGECGGESSIDPLLNALWDRCSFVQWEASAALVKIGAPVLARLVEGLRSPAPDIRTITAQLFTQITGVPPLQLMPSPADDNSSEADEDDSSEDEEDEVRSDADRTPEFANDIERLVNELTQGRKQAARQAAKALCDSADPKAWEALVEADRHGDEQVTKLTATALAKLCRLGDVRAMAASVASRVIEQLEDVPSDHATAVFRRALGHVCPGLRSRAERVLNDLGLGPADDEERRLRALIDADWDALRKLGPGPVPELLIAQLRDGERSDREDAAQGLGMLADGRAVEPLIAALTDEEERIRGTVADALGRLGDKRAVEPLIVRLRDRDAWVRGRAADALGELGDQRAVGRLGEAVTARGKLLRRAAVRALAKLGGAGTVDPFGKALRDADVEVRRLAAEALAAVGTEESGKLLTLAMNDEDDQVRAFAAAGLGRGRADGKENDFGQEPALIAGLHSPGRGGRRAAAEALAARGWEPASDEENALLLAAMENPLGAAEFGEAAVEPLSLALVDGGHYYLSETAAQCLGRILDPRAVPALCTALRDSTDLTVRGAAANALGQIRDRAAMPALTQALTIETEQWVVPYLKAAIEKIEAAGQIDRLVAALDDPEPKVQLRAAALLARRGDPRGPQWLERATHGNDTIIRAGAIAALQNIGGSVAIRGLIGRLSGAGFDGPNEAADALVKIGEQAVRPMVDALAEMTHNARWTTISALARMGSPAMAALCATLPGSEKELKKIACEVLGRMYDHDDVNPKPTEPLTALLEDPDADVRRYAAHGLDLLSRKH